MKSSVLLLTIIVMIFASCSEESSQSKPNELTEATIDSAAVEATYIASGMTIAKSTFKALSGELKEQIMEGGPDQALSFCNVHAVSLTDSLSQEFGATIQRVAVKYRNPKNEATGYDVEVYAQYLAQMNNKEELSPVIHYNESDQAVFYAPIVLKAQCVMCHGNPDTEIGDTTMMTITSLYANDKAVGFSPGELRGLWKVSFNN